MKNNKGAANIWIVVFVVVVAAGLGYFAVSQKSKTPVAPNQNFPTSTNPQVANNQNQIDDIKPSFKTYKNEDYHFLFQYPSHLSLKVEKSPYQRITLSEPENSSKTLTFNIETKEVIGEFLSQFPKNNIKDISVDNFKAISIDLGSSVAVSIEKDNYNYIITTSYEKNSKSESLFDQVFSTFRFIEPTAQEIRINYPGVAPVGEWWQTGKTYKVEWSGGSEKVDISLVSHKGGYSAQDPLVTSTVWSVQSIKNLGYYNIMVPENLADLDVKVQIKDSSGNFGESNYIEILNFDLDERVKEWDDIIPIEKPAIYLYPKTKSIISVDLNVNGSITKSIPEYNLGWKVLVDKNGKIDGKFDYLFYEADLKNLILPNEGWVVDFKNLGAWFDVNLIKLGLNRKELSDFKDYWLNRLPESKYYEIKLLTQSFLEKNMNLNVNPKPDSLIRLDFYFTPLKEKINIIEPSIETPARSGFIVVEWGGILDNQ